jgi:hypothetical protein
LLIFIIELAEFVPVAPAEELFIHHCISVQSSSKQAGPFPSAVEWTERQRWLSEKLKKRIKKRI